MSLEDIPSLFADAVDINEASAQVIMSIIVIFTFLLPTMILARGKNVTIIYLMVFLLAECLLVGIGWMPFWILIATVGVMSISIAFLGTGTVTGGG